MGRTTAIVIALIAVGLGAFLYFTGTVGNGDALVPEAQAPAIEQAPDAPDADSDDETAAPSE